MDTTSRFKQNSEQLSGLMDISVNVMRLYQFASDTEIECRLSLSFAEMVISALGVERIFCILLCSHLEKDFMIYRH